MPIYAFECSACGHHFDRLQKLSDADPTDCPKCGAAQLRRQLTAPQFRLAGGGWYETDFKKDGDRKRNLAGDSSAPKESGGGSDAKPDAKTDSKPAESKPATATPAASGASSGGSSGSSGSPSGSSSARS
ncbi:FmdB family zinc ribbon protein [Cognatilysobacter lacus]|uniref:Zinc ribbon domain-containing protein n=1 Tax=Cognatilysobacter lacus TaxID=1643323 RepID=A0A5D8YBT0_9GAMM|nr:zinc ribbon domain-containing protein [Lysobacter lacus]TZF80001.1 zinc ribbon domain-containing protein [Lysobacter lacus]